VQRCTSFVPLWDDSGARSSGPGIAINACLRFSMSFTRVTSSITTILSPVETLTGACPSVLKVFGMCALVSLESRGMQ